ncbi:MAG: GMC family oxidoreductase [Acidobacteria bacterium]|nr:GMC family oxidoreductase [Acidobacteriota bacterium]
MGRGLSDIERSALEAICDTLIPPGGPIPEGASDIDLAGEIAGWIGRFTPTTRRAVRAMILGFDATPLLAGRPRLFHQLSPEERDRWIGATGDSSFRLRREALGGLQALIQLAYASHPRIAAAIGYDGSPAVPVDWDRIAPPVRLPVRQYPEIRPGQDIEADVAIVGSGAGGAVAADALARAGLRVVLIEEGGAFNREDFRTGRPADRLMRLYRDDGLTVTIGTPIVALPMGRAVGGTTVINSGTCFRTPEEILHAWSSSGIPGVTPEEMAPWFDAVEETIGVAPVAGDILGPNGEAFRRGAAALGYSGGPIRRNARGCHGHGACAFGCPVDAKQGMHVSYLPRATQAGAEILAHVRARSVGIRDGRALGVLVDVLDPETERSLGTLRVRARATVLSAGAVYTPALLLRQRIADSSGQLGRNLVIHPGLGTTAMFDEDLRAWKGVMQSYYVDEKLKDGILLEATFPPPGIGYSAGSLPGTGRARKELFALYPQVVACGSIVSDGGNGRVRPMGRGGVLIRYDLSREDAAKAIEAVALAAEIYFAAGAKRVFPMLPGLPEISSPKEVAGIRAGNWKRTDLHLSAYHPMGTARMGPDPSRSVVDPWGAVWDVPGLHILDASIVPSSTHVNPQVTIMALVARSAARLADSLT